MQEVDKIGWKLWRANEAQEEENVSTSTLLLFSVNKGAKFIKLET
jgi:hypothetical protein